MYALTLCEGTYISVRLPQPLKIIVVSPERVGGVTALIVTLSSVFGTGSHSIVRLFVIFLYVKPLMFLVKNPILSNDIVQKYINNNFEKMSIKLYIHYNNYKIFII